MARIKTTKVTRTIDTSVTVVRKVTITAAQEGDQVRITFKGEDAAGKTISRRQAEALFQDQGMQVVYSGDDHDRLNRTTLTLTDTLIIRPPAGTDLRAMLDTARRAARQARKEVV